ncbi:MAG: hypothetical protein AB4063_12725 [Crocosphaera sp.]
MRNINKGTEPPNLTAWKKKNPHKRYNELSEDIRRFKSGRSQEK